MKAVVFHGIGDIRLEDVPEPQIKDHMDALVKITRTGICGTDLHMVRGTMPGVRPGTILGHEGIGTIEQLGRGVRNYSEGDRVLIVPNISCGYCSYCRAGYYSQCDNSNPNGRRAGSPFFGGPAQSGPFDGLQAEKARVPFANVGLVKIPDSVTDDQAITLCDVFPTGYFGADIAEIKPGDTVAVFGCGPVGQFAIISAFLFDAGRVFAVDSVQSRLDIAKENGAEVINFNEDDPVEVIMQLTGGIGVDRVIDAVGVDAEMPERGPAARKLTQKREEYERELKEITREGEAWHHGNAPSLVLDWAMDCIAKAGTLAVIGVYPGSAHSFPFGRAMNFNLTIQMGNSNHRKYIPILLHFIESGMVEVEKIFPLKHVPFDSIIEAYKAFDEHREGWVKVEMAPAPAYASPG